jgi:outer membrane protein OmpA-like peptidoglycan-associated protein
MHLRLLLLLSLFLPLCTYAQLVTESSEGTFVAYAGAPAAITPPHQGNFGSEVKIYSTLRQSQIQTLFMESKGTFQLRSLFFSPGGELLAVFTSSRWGYLYATRTGRVIHRLDFNNGVIGFLSDDSRYFLAEGNTINAYTPGNPKPLSKYHFSDVEALQQLYVTPDDKFLIAQTNETTWVWEIANPGNGRKYVASAHRYDPSRGLLTCMKAMNNDVVCTSLLLSNGRILRKSKVSQVTKRLPLKTDSLLAALHISSSAGSHLHFIFRSETASLSGNGTYLALQCQINGAHKDLVLLINNITKAYTFYEALPGKAPPFNWAGDSSLMIHKNEKEMILFCPGSDTPPAPLNTHFEFGKLRGEHPIAEDKQSALIRWSSDYRYLALPDKHKGAEQLYLLPALIHQQKSVADSAEFLSFGQSNKTVYFLDASQRLGYITTEDIEADMGSTHLTKHFFSDSLIIPIQGLIPNDPTPPAGYFFPKITSFKHISEAKPGTPLHVYLKTMTLHGKDDALQVHLIDTNGVCYYGAADSAWRKIWCNLLLSGPGNRLHQVRNFEVTEYREDKNFHNAMCLALDFSGSMGPARGSILQKGVLKFISTKLENEGIGVVKYDNMVVDECKVTGDGKLLEANMHRTSYEMMAKSTALLDALDHAIDQLKETSGYENKFIIIMTDGCENASLVSKRYIIDKALKNNIRIFTIGLGNYVSEGYLKSLSYNTQGSYYRIYNSENLDWIYQDIRNKIKNYYTLRFTTDTESPGPGNKVVLNICLDKAYTDTLTLQFDNTLMEEKLQKHKLKDDQITPAFVQLKNEQDVFLPDSLGPIRDFSRVTAKVAIPQKEATSTPTPVHDEIEAAFNSLEFPAIKFDFDKTSIVKGTDDGIENVIKFMQQHPSLKIEIQGHTDGKGTQEHNLPLSQARAEAVKNILSARGIAPSRMTAKGYGSEQPLVPNTSEENRQLNRRIDFIITVK